MNSGDGAAKGTKMPTVTLNDQQVDYATAVALMDDELREQLHDEMSPCTNQAFIDAYCAAHADKFGEEFSVN